MRGTKRFCVGGIVVLLAAVPGFCADGAETVAEYNVVWTSPSKDSSGSMPIGNGDVGLNLWVEQSGDLVFYISKTDSWSENARLLKLGLVRIRLAPGIFEHSRDFLQTLRLREGEIEIIAGKGRRQRTLRVWVDANRPVIRIEAEGQEQFGIEAKLEVWRTAERELKGAETNSARGLTRNDQSNYPIIVYPDVIVPTRGDSIVWYHRNAKSCYPVTLKNQHLGELLEKYPDPLMDRTFGGCIKGEDLKALDGVTLKSSKAARRFVVAIYPLTAQTDTSEAWLKLLKNQIAGVDAVDLETARTAHKRWWGEFWNRSWIRVHGGSLAQEITTNSLPLRIGACSNGSNRFIGHISRARVVNRALSEQEVGDLARHTNTKMPEGVVGDWPFEDPTNGLFANRADGKVAARIVGDLKVLDYEGRRCIGLDGGGYLEVAHNAKLDLPQGCTLEAWVAPQKLGAGGGRIIDKSESGTSNGYLLDTYPGNSLRLIVEAGTLTHDAELTPGKWVHVVGTYNAADGQSKLYIDGKVVAASKAQSGAFAVSRGYVLQRWINACAGRGAFPIKFNGTIFTVDAQVGAEHFDGDYRRWGGMYWWQNTRLPYWSMLAAGDFDLMGPVFRMYMDALGLCRDKTRIYYKHAGAFFPETMYFWGTNGNCDYGWGHAGPETVNRYIRREWQGGIEITAMMLDYYATTQDEEFLRKTLTPIADAVLTFYNEHWQRDAGGKIRFEPAQALETWWQCVNPTPEVAGLRYVIGRLLRLGDKAGTASQRAAWRKLLGDLPPVAVKEEEGKKFVLAAEKFDVRRNSENPELYAVFPYRLYGLSAGGLDVGLETWRRRLVKGSVGWRQDSIQAAYLGLAEEAARYVSGNFSTWHSGSRFPAFWGPNFDWVPDQDHGCVAMTALQRMLLQAEGNKILVLPAWPKAWDVHFKLHAPMNTTVECMIQDGSVRVLKVLPRSRRQDVKLAGPNQ
ncbi:MAG: LamG domain-containing protein [Planctomycetes bacterium]|nr:LamG domain-containing protein [Planctomycetota bacterium]